MRLAAGLAVLCAVAVILRLPALGYPLDAEEIALSSLGWGELATNPPLPTLLFALLGDGADKLWRARVVSMLASLVGLVAVGLAAKRVGASEGGALLGASVVGFAPAIVQQSTLSRSYGLLTGLLGLHLLAVASHDRRRVLTAAVLPWVHYAAVPIALLQVALLARERSWRSACLLATVAGGAVMLLVVSGGNSPAPSAPAETMFDLLHLEWQGVVLRESQPLGLVAALALLVACASHLGRSTPGLTSLRRVAWVAIVGVVVVGLVARVRHPIQVVWLVPAAALLGCEPSTTWRRRIHGAARLGVAALVYLGLQVQPSRLQHAVGQLPSVDLPVGEAVLLSPAALWTMWAMDGGLMVAGRTGAERCAAVDVPCYERDGRRWYRGDLDRVRWWLAEGPARVPDACAEMPVEGPWTLARCP